MKSHKSRLLVRPPKKDGEGLWAISYADFLMVLLSFFVIFFSADKNKNEMVKNHLGQVALDLQKIKDAAIQGTGLSGTGEGTGTGSGIAGSAGTGIDKKVLRSDLMNKLVQKLPDAVLVNYQDRDKIILRLPDNIYAPSGYRPQVQLLDPIIAQLTPHQERIQIKVIGHTDDVQFAAKGPRVVQDNMTLSGVRAAYSANYLRAFFPNMKITTEAGDKLVRNTRSISLEITLMEDEGI